MSQFSKDLRILARIKRKLEQMMGNELIPALLVRSIFFDSGRIIIFRIIFNSKQNLQEKRPFLKELVILCFISR